MTRTVGSAVLALWCLSSVSAQAQDAAGAADGAQPSVAAPPPAVETAPPFVCDDWRAPGLLEGPAAIGYTTTDFGTARRACPRTELGLGANMGLVIDRPNFYGNIGAQGLVYGSYALSQRTEIFGTLAFIDYQQVIGALTQSSLALGDMTVGLNQGVYATKRLVGSVVGRVLLPTASNVPNSRTLGAEVGHAVSLRASSWLEAHAYAGAGLTLGLSPAPLPRPSLLGLIGVQVSPLSWLSLVLDVSGGMANRSFLAPTVALRFRVYSLGIELGATLPLLGTDRHFVIGGARFAYRF